MYLTATTIQYCLEKYSFFCDSVILSFHVLFTDSSRDIALQVRCRNTDGQSTMVELRFHDVAIWSFSGNARSAPEVVTEGFRFRYDDQWLVDFGDDPDVDTSEFDWMDYSNKFVVAQKCSISELTQST